MKDAWFTKTSYLRNHNILNHPRKCGCSLASDDTADLYKRLKTVSVGGNTYSL